MKAKILTFDDETDKETYIDLYFDENKITGFYLTNDNFVDESVNVFFDSQLITLKREAKLIDYLVDKFNV